MLQLPVSLGKPGGVCFARCGCFSFAPGRAGLRADGLRGGVGTTLPTMFSRERGSQWSRGLRRVFSLLLPLYPAEQRSGLCR